MMRNLSALSEKVFKLPHSDLSAQQFMESVDLLYEHKKVFATDKTSFMKA